MQKIYLLLRSNKQTGPYSLEELLQLNLKPFDLVWVEGRSAAWQYPSEIPSLKPFVPETPHADLPFQPVSTSAMEEKIFQGPELHSGKQQDPVPQRTDSPKRVFVSVPKAYNTTSQPNNYPEPNAFAPKPQPVQERKEEIKTTVASYSQSIPSYSQPKATEEETRTNYSRSLNDVEDDYTNWVYKQKTKKKAQLNPKDLVLATLILVVIGGGYYMMSKPAVANSVLPANRPTAQTIEQPTEKNSDPSENKEAPSTEQKKSASTDNISTNFPTIPSKNIKTKNHSAVSKSQTNSSVPQVQNSMPVEKTNPNIRNNDNDVVIKNPETRPQSEASLPTEKKKKFGDVIKGIFSKQQKKEEPKRDETVLQDPKPANNRQATRRETEDNSPDDNSGTNEISTASLMEQIDISSNAPDNWMMGVKNLKVTLRNRSNATLHAASVAVSYYDENNQLLEKKLIYFSNVAPKAKAMVAAPDHKFADHIDLRLMTVSAKEDRYASY